MFPTEMSYLKGGRSVLEASPIAKFKPFLRNTLIVIGSRLEASEESNDTKYPILLKGNTQLANLVVRDAHEQVGHSGAEATLAKIREKFWIIKARQTVKTILKYCVICQKVDSRPLNPPFDQLPKERITAAGPFETVGIDYAGPFRVRVNSQKVSTQADDKKIWICLFTCASVRAVHLEIVENMSTEEFLLAFRRFCAKYQTPKLVISDNGRSFTRAAKEIQFLYDLTLDIKVQRDMAKQGVEWRFVTEYAPWQNGFVERMVGTVKRALMKIVGKRLLTHSQFRTTLDEVCHFVNSRPLCYFPAWEGGPDALTPKHFLFQRRDSDYGVRYGPKVMNSADEARLLWVERQQVINNLWKRWREEYLLQLRLAHTNTKGPSKGRLMRLEPGSTVIIKDDRLPRPLWKLGVIISCRNGRDGYPRSYTVRLATGHTTNRAPQHLYPLELQEPPVDAHDSDAKAGGRFTAQMGFIDLY